MIEFQVRRQSSTISALDEDIEDDSDERKERQQSGSIKFSTHKAYFKAADSHFYLVFIVVMFIVTQFGWSGSDYFLSEW